MLLEFIYLPTYEDMANGLMNPAMEDEMEQLIAEAPERGAVVAGTSGWRKIRIAVAGQGKSGGVRVLYYYRRAAGQVLVGMVYAKKDADNLSAAGKRILADIARDLE